MTDDGFERLLRGFLREAARTACSGLLGMTAYGLGYAAIFWEMPPASVQIGYFVCLGVVFAADCAYRLIFKTSALAQSPRTPPPPQRWRP